MTRIEIIEINESRAVLALYYPVPQPDPSAVGRGPTPVGIRLDTQEVVDLLDGRLVELVRTVGIAGLSKGQVRAAIEAEWAANASVALSAYARRFRNESFKNFAWDGTNWS